VLSGGDGGFSFADIAPGAFQLTVTATGFATRTFSGTLYPGEIERLPPMALEVAAAITEVQVGLTRAEVAEVAEQQLKIEEKQRVLGIIPNFYVSYVPHAAPLTAKQKFKLAMRTVVDPFTFLVVGGTAGVEQAQNHFFEYGQGAEGYAKRFGANYADTVTGTFIGGGHSSVAAETRSALFLQRNGKHAITISVCHWHVGDLQGRQWALAAKLLRDSWKPGCGGYFKPLLSGDRSGQRGINFR